MKKILPLLLERLSCKVTTLNCNADGNFTRGAEPLPHNLSELSKSVIETESDLGIAIDPDGDRLAIVDEKGNPIGEESTLVICCESILMSKEIKTPLVTNLSTSMAIDELAKKYDVNVSRSNVGEINVVTEMKKVNAVIGGEGNGGVIYPKSHYGRDAIVGIGLFLSLYSERGLKASELLETYPKYFMLKEKINLSNNLNVDKILNQIAKKYKNEKLDLIDGVRIDFNESWVQLRKSNTESIIRIYSEAKSIDKAAELVNEIDDLVKEIIN